MPSASHSDKKDRGERKFVRMEPTSRIAYRSIQTPLPWISGLQNSSRQSRDERNQRKFCWGPLLMRLGPHATFSEFDSRSWDLHRSRSAPTPPMPRGLDAAVLTLAKRPVMHSSVSIRDDAAEIPGGDPMERVTQGRASIGMNAGVQRYIRNLHCFSGRLMLSCKAAVR